MKLQFSLATLLVCMTVLAVVIAVSIRVPVYEFESYYPEVLTVVRPEPHSIASYWVHKPGAADVAWRLAWAGPLSIAATLAVLWLIRRLKSPNRPPVG